MVRFINYMTLFVLLAAPINVAVGGNLFLYYPAIVIMGLVLHAILKFIPFEDNLTLLAFLVSGPYIFYLTTLPVGYTSVWATMGIVFLAASTPLVLNFLFLQLTEPLEG